MIFHKTGSHQLQACGIINSVYNRERTKTVAKKDTFNITTRTRQYIGEVTVFIRVTYFPTDITTAFHIPENEKMYLFKSDTSNLIFHCKKIPSVKCTCANNGNGEASGTCCPPETQH